MIYDIEKLRQLPIYFIVGAARSGTTLLEKILNAHPKVVSMGELRYTMVFWDRYRRMTTMPPQFMVDVDTHEKMRLKNVGKAKRVAMDNQAIEKRQRFKQILSENAPLMDYASVSKLMLLRNHIDRLEQGELEALVNKNPDYIFYVKQLLSLYPAAKIVACIRDPRGVVLSHKQHKGKNDFSQYMGDDVSAVAYFWKVCNDEILALQQQYPNQIALIHYEKLVADKENTLREVASFLNISFHPNLLEHDKHSTFKKKLPADDQQAQQWEQKKNDDLHRNVYTDRLTAWQNELSPDEIAIVNHICHETTQKLGYDSQVISISWTKKITIALSTFKSYLVCKLFIIHYYQIPFALRQLLIKYLKIRK